VTSSPKALTELGKERRLECLLEIRYCFGHALHAFNRATGFGVAEGLNFAL
jgi:hypothetical protein